jgi:hypothetical protein
VGTTAATLVGVTAGSGVSLDATNVTATFANATVGTNKTVQVAGLVLSGPNAANYSLTQPTTTATISPVVASVSGVTVDHKTYDGTLTARASYTGLQLTGILTGETVTAVTTGASASFADKAVGSGKAVTLTGITLTGAQAANYTLSLPTLSADITPKPITVTGITVAGRVYDTTALLSPSFAGAALVGVVQGDTVALDSSGAVAAMDDSRVGLNKPVTFTGIGLSGAEAGNYSLTQPTATATITAKNLTVIGATAATKIYDRNATATLSLGSAALVGIISPDDVTLLTGAATGTFADANTGRNKVVTVAGLALSGADSVNYSLTQPRTTADITIAEATLTISNLANVYNGTPRAVTVTVTPAGVPFTVGYPTTGGGAPTDAGSYVVTANVTDSNYSGTASQTLVIEKAKIGRAHV